MVIGDYNARIGEEDARFTYHETTHRNGKFLLDLASERNLIITNTMFQKKKGKLWTFVSPGGNKYQLDYILVRKKWRNSLLNSEAYSSFASVGSDRRIVSAKMRLSLRKSKTAARRRQYDWKLLSTDSNLQKQYTIKVRNRFQPLENISETTTEKYERLITAHTEATDKTVPVRKKVHRVRFSNDPRVNEARDKIKKAYEAKKRLADAYNQVEEEDLSSKLIEVETAHANSKHGQSWRLINDITSRLASRKGQLEGNTQKERVTNWYNHFKNLLGSPPDIDDEDKDIPAVLDELNIKTGPFEQEEYEKAKMALVEGKSSGKDGIPPEVLKRCDIDDIILGFCNHALSEGETPEQWSILNIVPIPKSGDLSQAGNYRGISLSSIVAKTFNRMILNRIRPELDERLRNNQNGFRVDKNCHLSNVGETSRIFGTRLAEHQAEVKKANGNKFPRSERRTSEMEQIKSAISDHVTRANHVIDWEESKIRGREHNKRSREDKGTTGCKSAVKNIVNEQDNYQEEDCWLSTDVNTEDYTATAGVDYTPLLDDPVYFTPDATDATVSLNIIDDADVDPGESLVVYIAIQVNGEVYHGSFTYITIIDND
ncbi:uncharacterized protein [Amphiura filiformis]|uniref:uncharacterized protein n=1 Tax=Amphiura filiformis TaxID=82378 RepID=UPI003B21699A